MLATRTVRAAAKAPAARAAPVRPRTTPVRAMSGQGPELTKMAETAAAAGKEYIAKAQEVLKDLDVDKVKDTVKGAATMGVDGVKTAISTALGTWEKFDGDGDGKLEIEEAVALLNSDEVTAVVEKVTAQPHTKRTADDIKKWFNRADFDKSGTLSKREFTVMYAGLLADKAKLGAQGMAGAVVQALDSDGDGIINSTDLKALLSNSPLAPVVAVIPDNKQVNYRELLAKIPGAH